MMTPGGGEVNLDKTEEKNVVARGGWYTPVDSDLIPTGEISPVTGTVFDLTGGAALGQIINSVPGSQDNPGFDHNFVIAR